METQVVTIPIQTTMDPAQLLDIILDFVERLEGDIESYEEKCVVDTDNISVESE